MGKIRAEGVGEVKEFIDICDFACGLSRSLAGQVIPSERPDHFMMEQWNPLGLIGVITAFNFPVAVFGWNLALALICGNCVHWKGAPSTPLCTIATANIVNAVLNKHNAQGVLTVSVGGKELGERLVDDKRIHLISFTGSTQVGRIVAGRYRHILSILSYYHIIILSYYRIIILSYYRIIILSYYHIIVLSFYHIIILSYYHIIILSYYHIIILSYYHIIILSYYHIIILSYYRIIILSYYHIIILSYYHIIILSYYHFIILSYYHIIILL